VVANYGDLVDDDYHHDDHHPARTLYGVEGNIIIIIIIIITTIILIPVSFLMCHPSTAKHVITIPITISLSPLLW